MRKPGEGAEDSAVERWDGYRRERGWIDRETVKRPDLFGHVHDTYATETELNGFKPTQGALI